MRTAASMPVPSTLWIQRQKQPRFAFPQIARLTRFSNDDVHGYYFEALLRGEFHGVKHWVFGLTVPVVHLHVENGKHTGLANALLFSERRWPLPGGWAVKLGGQLEVPVGDSKAGIAPDHFEVFPYAGVSKTLGQSRIYADVGVRLSLHGSEETESEAQITLLHGGGDNEANKPLLVTPHEDQELLYRAGLATQLLGGLHPSLELSGTQVLSHTSSGHTFIHVGTRWFMQLGRSVGIIALAELPVSRPARYNWRLGLGVQYQR